MIQLIMCIGFSVDFSAHISYAYVSARAVLPDDKVRFMFNLALGDLINENTLYLFLDVFSNFFISRGCNIISQMFQCPR